LQKVTESQDHRLAIESRSHGRSVIRKYNPSIVQAIKTDGASLVRDGKIVSLLEIKMPPRNMYNRRKGINRTMSVPESILELSFRTGAIGLRILIEIVEKKICSI